MGRTHRQCASQMPIDYTIAVYKYNNTLKNIIHQLKYKFSFAISDFISELIIERIRYFRIPPKALITCIPLHSKRHAWRGFNQAEIIAQKIAPTLGYQFVKLLKRNHETHVQAKYTSAKERAQNVKNAFELLNPSSKELFAGKNIVIFDDIITTGSTINEAAKVVRQVNPASIGVMCLGIAIGSQRQQTFTSHALLSKPEPELSQYPERSPV